jgi:hypothetical protein
MFYSPASGHTVDQAAFQLCESRPGGNARINYGRLALRMHASPLPGRHVRVPVYQDYINPILGALRSAGRPLVIEELEQRVFELMALPAEVLAISHDSEKSDRSEVSYRMAWARTYLKRQACWTIPSSARGH